MTTVMTAEILSDVLTNAGASAVWPVGACALLWLVLRKFGWQPNAHQLGSEGA
jgi:hypothetical protein